MARWLVRFGYDGRNFSGWARQPGLRSIEGEIMAGLVRSGNYARADAARIMVSSRTDRGVHARGNALTLTSPLEPIPLLRALNGMSTEIFFTHARKVDPSFVPRRACERWYRYLEPADGRDLERWAEGARLLEGRVDVRSFGRSLPTDRPTWRTISSVAVTRSGPILHVDVRAPSFVWGMVRKIVAALREFDQGRLSVAALRAAVGGTRRLTLPIAEADRLVLWDVDYGVPWEFEGRSPSPRRRAVIRAAREEAVARSAVLDALYPGGTPP